MKDASDPVPLLDTAAARMLGGVGKVIRITSFLFLLPCLGLIGGAGWLGWGAYVAVTVGQSVGGHWVGTTAAGPTGSMETATYYITYEFTDASGQVRRARSLAATNLLPTPSEAVALLWNPERPEVVRRAGFLWLWGLPTLLGGMGLVFLVPVLVIRRIVRQAQRRVA